MARRGKRGGGRGNLARDVAALTRAVAGLTAAAASTNAPAHGSKRGGRGGRGNSSRGRPRSGARTPIPKGVGSGHSGVAGLGDPTVRRVLTFDYEMSYKAQVANYRNLCCLQDLAVFEARQGNFSDIKITSVSLIANKPMFGTSVGTFSFMLLKNKETAGTVPTSLAVSQHKDAKTYRFDNVPDTVKLNVPSLWSKSFESDDKDTWPVVLVAVLIKRVDKNLIATDVLGDLVCRFTISVSQTLD